MDSLETPPKTIIYQNRREGLLQFLKIPFCINLACSWALILTVLFQKKKKLKPVKWRKESNIYIFLTNCNWRIMQCWHLLMGLTQRCPIHTHPSCCLLQALSPQRGVTGGRGSSIGWKGLKSQLVTDVQPWGPEQVTWPQRASASFLDKIVPCTLDQIHRAHHGSTHWKWMEGIFLHPILLSLLDWV